MERFNVIHTTIGVYPNGDYKVNGVCSENLADHIHYNLTYRPGRAFVLDGVVLYKGSCPSEAFILSIRRDIPNATIDTIPYV